MRLPPRLLALLAAVLWLSGGCAPRPATAPAPPVEAGPAASTELVAGAPLGMPGPAEPDGSDRRRFLIERTQYTVSYNDALGRPNWASWRLAREDLGDVERGRFQPDPDLPEGFTRIVPRDYTGSGYDRGHLCPSGDRTASEEDNRATFYMTNIAPQAPGNNQGPWRDLEEYCRELVARGQVLFIVAGTAGESGAIAGGRVTVPEAFWKVVVALPDRGVEAPAAIDARTRVIAVWMPNESSIEGEGWRSFRVSVGAVERGTGLHLLTAVPEPTRSALKRRVDRG
ncbi:MAG: DNA/RNA non-specific endonuclease [Chthonomonadales bacterium]|nr:DNA/RNA non-specific endonuclease [Chthonomonadales bacterium]